MKSLRFSAKNWTLARRLVTGFTGILFLTILLAGASLFGLRMLEGQLSRIGQDSMPGVVDSSKVLAAAYQYRVLTLRHLIAEDPAEMVAIDKQCDELAPTIARLLTAYEQSITTAEDRRLFSLINPAFQAYRTEAKRVRELSSAGRVAEARAAMNAAMPLYDAFDKAVNDLSAFNETGGSSAVAEASTVIAVVNRFVSIVALLAVGVGAIAAVIITRGVNRAVRNVATGIDDASTQVAAAADQVSASSQSLAEGASEQAASLEETSASLEEMASMAKRNRESAEQAKELATQTRRSAEAGSSHMEQMRRAMDEIKMSSSEIGKIVKTIDEIAFQTNILALNAAVEAARAGDAGAGFAVVADEVRTLAQRSAESARETAAKIEVAIQKSHQGVTISGSVAQSLAEILENARRVDQFVAEIADASREQNEGIQQVNTAVNQMDKVTQSNASNAEEAAAAAEELNGQAMSLRESVEQLTRLIGGSAVAAPVEQAPATRPAPSAASKVGPEAGEAKVKPATPAKLRAAVLKAPSKVMVKPASNGVSHQTEEETLTFFR